MVSNKKIGLGSLSLILFVIGLIFSVTLGNQGAYGDKVLESVGLQSWSNGNTGIHYTIFYSLLFFVPALVLSRKHQDNIRAKIGGRLSLVIIIFIIINMLAL